MTMRSLDLNKQVVIFSAFRSELSEATNEYHHLEAMEVLRDNGIRFKEVLGVYKGVSEKSIVVVLDSVSQLHIPIGIANRYNQESVLILDADTRKANLYYLKSGQSESIGVFEAVSESEAKSRDAYTFDHVNNVYYIAY